MTVKQDEIRHKLSRHEPVTPPPDLLAKLKNQIPEHLTFATERERATVSALRGSAWRIAASVILLAGVGWIGLTALKSSPAPFVRAKEVQRAAARQEPAFAPQLDAASAKTSQNEPAPEDSLRAKAAPMAEPQVAAVEQKPAPSQPPSLSREEPPGVAETIVAKSSKDEKRDEVARTEVPALSASSKAEIASNEVDDKRAAGELKKESDQSERRNARAVTSVAAAPPPPPPAAVAARSAGAAVPQRFAFANPAVVEAMRPPVALACAPLAYPEEARKAKVQGVAIVAAVIGADGKVESTELVQSLPHGLGRAAEEAVRNCRFQPATLDGHPIRTRFEVPVRFDLEKGSCVICESGH